MAISVQTRQYKFAGQQANVQMGRACNHGIQEENIIHKTTYFVSFILSFYYSALYFVTSISVSGGILAQYPRRKERARDKITNSMSTRIRS